MARDLVTVKEVVNDFILSMGSDDYASNVSDTVVRNYALRGIREFGFDMSRVVKSLILPINTTLNTVDLPDDFVDLVKVGIVGSDGLVYVFGDNDNIAHPMAYKKDSAGSPIDSDNDGIKDGNDLWHTTNKTVAEYYTPENASYWERFWWNDFDGDGFVNALDIDSDNDSDYDGNESEDSNRDGRRQPGEGDPLDNDEDEDGIIDNIEADFLLSKFDDDCDNDGVKDGYELNWYTDLDNDSYINALDPDSDGDGLIDGVNRTISRFDQDFTDFAVTHGIPYINQTEPFVLFIGEASLGTEPYN